MKKLYFILLFVLFLTSIIGCTSNSKKNDIKEVDVYTGSYGLDFEFVKDAPPVEVIENQSFDVIALLKNKGPYPINNGKIIVSYNKDDFRFGTREAFFQLKGKDMYNPLVDEKIKSFFVETIPLLETSVVLDSSILLTACYDYSNKLSTEICVDTDPYKLKPVEKSCQIKDQSFSGQGGQVGISRIEQKTLVSDNGIRPQFLIYIKNFGQGDVISKDKINEMCGSQTITRDDINGITLKDVRFSKYSFSDMDCTPSRLRLINGEDKFLCTLNENSKIPLEDSNFKTNLYIEFDYGYTITKAKDVKIKKANTRI